MTFKSLSSRPVLDGGTNTQDGSRGATQYEGADNVIQLADYLPPGRPTRGLSLSRAFFLEAGAWLMVITVVLIPWMLVAATVFLYLALIS